MPLSHCICTVNEVGISTELNLVYITLSLKSFIQSTLALLALCCQTTYLPCPEWYFRMHYTPIGPRGPAHFRKVQLSAQFIGDLPSLGTKTEFARTGGRLCFCFTLCLFKSFTSSFQFGLFLWWKDKANIQRSELGMPVIGFLSQSPATMQSHASEGTFLRAPAHSTLPLLSTRYCISSSYTCPGADDKLPHAASWFACVLGSVGSGLTWSWVPVLTLHLASCVALESYLTFPSLRFLIC